MDRVAAVVWPWRGQDRSPGAAPAKSPLPRATVGAVVGLTAAALFYYFDHRTMATIVAAVAAFIWLSAAFVRPLFFKIEWAFQMLGLGVGHVLTWVLLVPFFYLFFTPGSLWLRLRGKDPLHRACPSHEPTYWTPRSPVDDPQQYYRRQF